MMVRSMSSTALRIRDLAGLGPRSEEMLAAIGIKTVNEFMATDPFEMYGKLKSTAGMGLNGLYAIIGAQVNRPWLEVAQTRKTEILMRLDDLGMAPK